MDLKKGASFGHGGKTGVLNHIPGFSIATLFVYYDRRPNHARGNPMNADMDNFRIATVPWIPEPASFALFLRHFQPFTTPGPLHTLVVDPPAV